MTAALEPDADHADANGLDWSGRVERAFGRLGVCNSDLAPEPGGAHRDGSSAQLQERASIEAFVEGCRHGLAAPIL